MKEETYTNPSTAQKTKDKNFVLLKKERSEKQIEHQKQYTKRSFEIAQDITKNKKVAGYLKERNKLDKCFFKLPNHLRSQILEDYPIETRMEF